MTVSKFKTIREQIKMNVQEIGKRNINEPKNILGEVSHLGTSMSYKFYLAMMLAARTSIEKSISHPSLSNNVSSDISRSRHGHMHPLPASGISNIGGECQ